MCIYNIFACREIKLVHQMMTILEHLMEGTMCKQWQALALKRYLTATLNLCVYNYIHIIVGSSDIFR